MSDNIGGTTKATAAISRLKAAITLVEQMGERDRDAVSLAVVVTDGLDRGLLNDDDNKTLRRLADNVIRHNSKVSDGGGQ